jgi:hypothetical protein
VRGGTVVHEAVHEFESNRAHATLHDDGAVTLPA